MKRRTFLELTSLQGMGFITAVSLPTLLTGCNAQTQNSFTVRLLKNSIPAVWLGQFRKSLTERYPLNVSAVPQLQDLYQLLQQLPPTNTPNLITLGDYWLETAIQQQLILPLDAQRLQHWQNLPPLWRQLVQRNAQGKVDPQGQVWGAPYLGGSTVIIYNRNRFKALGWYPQDWADLWRPELQGKISLLNHPRIVIGLTLKKLNQSYNTENLQAIPTLKTELAQLNRQTKFYASENYLQPLIEGDTWVAVGWSTDILNILPRYRQLAVSTPRSGTSLWANVWVRPQAESQLHPLVNPWIDFCWLKSQVAELSLLTNAISPVVLGMNRTSLPLELQNNGVLLPEESILAKSEFLLPLSQPAIEQYTKVWQEMRSQVV